MGCTCWLWVISDAHARDFSGRLSGNWEGHRSSHYEMCLYHSPIIITCSVLGMPSPVYVRCSNPGCGKLNPVYGEVFPSREYTCVFCGHLFKAQAKTIVETVEKTKLNRGKKDRRTETRPQNRNLRKPLI